MKGREKEIIDRLYKVGYEEFLSEYPRKVTDAYIVEELKNAIYEEDSDTLGYILLILYKRGFFPELCQYLTDLMVENWHKEHENIAMVLQFDVKCPDSVDNLIKAMEMKYDYLFFQDDYEPFVTKCMYAIGDLGTDYALKRLNDLTEYDDPVISKAAQHQLDRLAEDTKQAALKKDEEQSEKHTGLSGMFEIMTEQQRHMLEESMGMEKGSMTKEMCEEVDRKIRMEKEKKPTLDSSESR